MASLFGRTHWRTPGYHGGAGWRTRHNPHGGNKPFPRPWAIRSICGPNRCAAIGCALDPDQTPAVGSLTGGATGTLAAMGDKGPGVARQLAAELDLRTNIG